MFLVKSFWESSSKKHLMFLLVGEKYLFSKKKKKKKKIGWIRMESKPIKFNFY